MINMIDLKTQKSILNTNKKKLYLLLNFCICFNHNLD